MKINDVFKCTKILFRQDDFRLDGHLYVPKYFHRLDADGIDQWRRIINSLEDVPVQYLLLELEEDGGDYRTDRGVTMFQLTEAFIDKYPHLVATDNTEPWKYDREIKREDLYMLGYALGAALDVSPNVFAVGKRHAEDLLLGDM